MTTGAAKKRATYADLYTIPETWVGQIIDGELVAHSRPAVPHSMAELGLAGDLFSLFQRGRGGPGGWWILSEAELHLADDILVPDVAGWRRERMPIPPAAPYVTLAPDWLCEVLSPGTAAVDRVRKLPIYSREQVRHVWFVDPIAKTLEVLRVDGTAWLLVQTFSGDERARAEPFDAVELELSAYWLPEASAPAAP
jgi:Uma2 family endonuclease